MKTIALASVVLGSALVAATASAADVLAIDLASAAQGQVIAFASPTVPYTSVDLKPYIALNFRTAFSKAAPLTLPCDVDFLAGGISWKNVSGAHVYVEMSGALYYDGNEHRPLVNVWGQTRGLAPTGITNAGTVGTGGFIFLTAPPLYNFSQDPSIVDPTLSYMSVPGYEAMTPSQLAPYAPGYIPANVPIKINYRVRAFSNNVYDPARGGYTLSDLVADTVIWSDVYSVWITRSCPAN
jgi:hypothetical protein